MNIKETQPEAHKLTREVFIEKAPFYVEILNHCGSYLIQVFIEKKPFYEEILHRCGSYFWWYHIYTGEEFFVRQATNDDINKDLKDLLYLYCLTYKDIFIVCSENYRNYVILKRDTKRV